MLFLLRDAAFFGRGRFDDAISGRSLMALSAFFTRGMGNSIQYVIVEQVGHKRL